MNQEYLRIAVIALSAVFAAWIFAQLYRWHIQAGGIDLRDLVTAPDKRGRERISRMAIAELVALFATTSGYMGVLAVKPELYETCTLVYGGIWVVRGGYATYLRSKEK